MRLNPKKLFGMVFTSKIVEFIVGVQKKFFAILMADLGKMKMTDFSLLSGSMASQIVSFERASNFRQIRFFVKNSIFPKSKTLLGLEVSSWK